MSVIVTRRMLLLAALVLSVLPGAAAGQTTEFPDVTIADSRARLVALDGVHAGTWRYRYEIENPSTSDTGVFSLRIDVSASLGEHPAMLTVDGRFFGDGTRLAPNASAGHVPVGMVIPNDWRGRITASGWIEWWGPSARVEALDPVRPGATRADFVLRSTYLPGIRSYWLLPEYPYICCGMPAGDPRAADIDVKTAEDFKVAGAVPAPMHPPDAMEVGLVRRQLDRACDELGWISPRGICRSLDTKLAAAGRAIERGRSEAARGQLRAFTAELDAHRSDPSGKHIDEDAYWLLRTNAAVLIGRI